MSVNDTDNSNRRPRRKYEECDPTKTWIFKYKLQKARQQDHASQKASAAATARPPKPNILKKLTLDWEKELPKVNESTKYLLSYKVIKASTPYEENLVEKPLEGYITESSYEGQHDALSFSGNGIYYYPHGVKYDGQFKDGHFHGEGTLIYPNKQKVTGVWRKGKLKQYVFKYADDVEYCKDWDFLKMPYRSYHIEAMEGFGAPNNEYVCPNKDNRKIPYMAYDTGDKGFYDNDKKVVFAKNNKMSRIVYPEELETVTELYYQECDKPTGYRPEFYEHWTSGRDDDVKRIEKLFFRESLNKYSEAESSTSNTIYSIY